MIATIPR